MKYEAEHLKFDVTKQNKIAIINIFLFKFHHYHPLCWNEEKNGFSRNHFQTK